jgi:type 1 glutamine amidotransferase
VLATAYDDPNNQPKPEHSGQENTQTAQVSKSASQWPRLDMNPTGKNEPMLWTLAYGRGRSFYTALGHDTRAMAMPGFSTTFVRGVEWAARGTVRKPEPDFRSWAEAPFARRP